MEHLNYCRQVRKQFVETIETANPKEFDTGQYGAACRAIDDAEKYLLPDGGTTWSEPTYALLDDTVPLKLPSKVIALEFSNYAAKVITKCVCLAFEDTFEGTIYVRNILWDSGHRRWRVFAPACFPNVNYFQDRGLDESGIRQVKLHVDGFDLQPVHLMAAWTLLSFMNALQCVNVRPELSLAKTRAKTDEPFHHYKILRLAYETEGRSFAMDDFKAGTIIQAPEGKIWINHDRKEH